jgi:hypothetical protein
MGSMRAARRAGMSEATAEVRITKIATAM